MLVGILSDTHGQIAPVRQALATFEASGAQAIFHCGDLGGMAVLAELASSGKRLFFVWGNMDDPQSCWTEDFRSAHITLPTGPYVVELDGRRILLAHGHEPELKRLAADPTLDYVLTGHSHRRHDRRVGRTRHVNPGALHRVAIRSVATLDLAADDLRFHELP